jgi:hypothetical protein
MKGLKMVKISVPAGRYFVGDVSGLTRPVVAIPARASVFYSDDGAYEFEVAGGGSSFPDENAFGVFGVIEFDATGLGADDAEFYCVFDLAENTEILFDFDYLEIVGVLKISVCRDAGLKFTDPDEAFDLA